MIPCVISVDMYVHVSMFLWLSCSTLGSSYSNGPIVTLPRLADTLPVNVPDASDWSIDDVERYFKDVGFVEQAEVFREQVWFTWYLTKQCYCGIGYVILVVITGTTILVPYT